MKRILPVCTALLLGCSMGAWAQSMDTNFAKQAAMGGMAEVKLGQLAVDKGSSDFVKQFGQKMVDDHGKANDQLKSVAAKDSITLPTDISPKDQALFDRLSKLSGAAFDSA
jgi:putative membrane protein